MSRKSPRGKSYAQKALDGTTKAIEQGAGRYYDVEKNVVIGVPNAKTTFTRRYKGEIPDYKDRYVFYEDRDLRIVATPNFVFENRIDLPEDIEDEKAFYNASVDPFAEDDEGKKAWIDLYCQFKREVQPRGPTDPNVFRGWAEEMQVLLDSIKKVRVSPSRGGGGSPARGRSKSRGRKEAKGEKKGKGAARGGSRSRSGSRKGGGGGGGRARSDLDIFIRAITDEPTATMVGKKQTLYYDLNIMQRKSLKAQEEAKATSSPYTAVSGKGLVLDGKKARIVWHPERDAEVRQAVKALRGRDNDKTMITGVRDATLESNVIGDFTLGEILDEVLRQLGGEEAKEAKGGRKGGARTTSRAGGEGGRVGGTRPGRGKSAVLSGGEEEEAGGRGGGRGRRAGGGRSGSEEEEVGGGGGRRGQRASGRKGRGGGGGGSATEEEEE